MMDLNDALHYCRLDKFIRDDANMNIGWKIKFEASGDDARNFHRPPHERSGQFRYVDPKGEDAHVVRFTDAHKSSTQWRTTT